MIKELTLTNWKSFAEATLYIDPLTVLIGSNAGGKSNTLDALLFLHRVSRGVALFPAIAGDVNLAPLRGGLEWVCRKPHRQFGLSVTLDGRSAEQDYRYDLTVQINGTKAEVFAESLTQVIHGPRAKTPKERTLFQTKQEETSAPGIPTYISTGTTGPGKRVDLNRAQTILGQIESLNVRKEVQEGAGTVLAALQKIFVFDPIPSHMRGYVALSEELLADGANIAGVLAGLPVDEKERVEDQLTAFLKHLPEHDIQRIWTETVGKFNTDAMLYCEEGWQGAAHVVDARGMSDGTLRYLAIVTALLTRASGSLLVVEEVDNGLHPSRTHFLVDMLKSLGKKRGIDVLVTTHNPALLDAAGLGMLPFIAVAHRDDETGCSTLTQLEDIALLPKLMAAGSLGRLSTEGRIEQALKHEAGR